ncbi:MAG: hypothetical protein K0R28_92 [Paenibacillus sp.]|jgi:hypothetical protein|nr:hypothetical protein [Paenibacillus sp.]
MSKMKNGIDLREFAEELQAFIAEANRGTYTGNTVQPYVENLKQIILKHMKLS